MAGEDWHRDGLPAPPTMRAVRLHAPGGPEHLELEEVETPGARAGDALVRVHAAAITRDELEWPTGRLPAIPSYELSGVVVAVGPDVDDALVGQSLYGLTPFDRDGVAAEYAAVPAEVLAPKPRELDHVESAAVPLPALTAWQALVDHGGMEAGQRVLVHGAAGGVGHLVTQIARARGAHVVATTSTAGVDAARGYGASQVIDTSTTSFDEAVDPVDLVVDTAGGELLRLSHSVVREGGRIVSIAEEPPETSYPRAVTATYFVVEPNREQLAEIAALIDRRELRPAVDTVLPLADARAAFERSLAPGKRGKVVLRVVEDEAGGPARATRLGSR